VTGRNLLTEGTIPAEGWKTSQAQHWALPPPPPPPPSSVESEVGKFIQPSLSSFASVKCFRRDPTGLKDAFAPPRWPYPKSQIVKFQIPRPPLFRVIRVVRG